MRNVFRIAALLIPLLILSCLSLASQEKENTKSEPNIVTVITRDAPSAAEKLAAEEMAHWVRENSDYKAVVAELSKGYSLPGKLKIAVYIKGKPIDLGKLLDNARESEIMGPWGPQGYSVMGGDVALRALLVVSGTDPLGLLYGVQQTGGYLHGKPFGLYYPDPVVEVSKSKLTWLEGRVNELMFYGKPCYAFRTLVLASVWDANVSEDLFGRMTAVDFARTILKWRYNTVTGLPEAAGITAKERGMWISTLRKYYLDFLAPVDLRSGSIQTAAVEKRCADALASYPGASGIHVIMPESSSEASRANLIRSAVKAARGRIVILDNFKLGDLVPSHFAGLPDTVRVGVKWESRLDAGKVTSALKSLNLPVMFNWRTPAENTLPVGLTQSDISALEQMQFTGLLDLIPNFAGFTTILGYPEPNTMEDIARGLTARLAWSPTAARPDFFAGQLVELRFGANAGAPCFEAIRSQHGTISDFTSVYPARKTGHGIMRYLGREQLKGLDARKLAALEDSLNKWLEAQRNTVRLIDEAQPKLADLANRQYRWLQAQAGFYRGLLSSRAALVTMSRNGATPELKTRALQAIDAMLAEVEKLQSLATTKSRKAELTALANALKAEKKGL